MVAPTVIDVETARQPRPWAEVREIMLERARNLRNPFTYTIPAEVERILDNLGTIDRDAWGRAFGAAAAPYAAEAAAAEERGDAQAAQDSYLRAYDYHRVARYPAPNSPVKRDEYRVSLTFFHKAAAYFDPPIERVVMPFHARPGEGSASIGLLRKPAGVAKPPVVVIWGGIDSFKEERPVEAYVEAGMAGLAIDMPGVGEAPIPGSEDAERMWDAVFDWIATRPDLDSDRVAIVGGSTGGYWGTKLAHTHRDRLRAAVNQGGPAHFAFRPAWINRAQRGEYPFELAETLASAFGRSSYDDWVQFSPKLSLLDQGILDRPCAPLLCVNGVDDSVFPIQDMYLLLEHGDPKTARFFPGGHMGNPWGTPTIIAWLQEQLEVAQPAA